MNVDGEVVKGQMLYGLQSHLLCLPIGFIDLIHLHYKSILFWSTELVEHKQSDT